MRTLRTRAVGVLATLVGTLGLAGAASASSISFVWVSTSGAGVGVGTPTLSSVSVGDTAVLQININVTSPGVAGIGVSMDWNPSDLLGVAEQICPATAGNPFGPGTCGLSTGTGPDFTNFLTPFPPTPVIDNVTGSVGFLVANGTPGSGQSAGTVFELAHVTFSVVSSGTTVVSPFFRGGIDGEVPVGGGFFIPPAVGATLNAIPEPGTIALVAFGLGALAFAGRRRR